MIRFTSWAGLALLVASAAAQAAALQVGPYVQDLQRDGFTVVFDTPTATTAQVVAGEHSVETTGRHHVAVLRGLPPGARVAYRVRVADEDLGGGEVALYEPGRPFTFVVYGDNRGGALDAEVAALARAQQPLFALHTGDFAVRGGDGDAWQSFFTDEAPLLRDVPLYPALGNHELIGDPDLRHFRHYFELPDEGRTRLYYSFRMGPVAVVVLDGNHPTPAQTAWLETTLEAARRDGVSHLFALEHQPPLSVGSHCGSAIKQADWMALFEKYGVRAVFAGHDHAYERMVRRGVHYFVSGGAGAPLYRERLSCPAFDRAARQLYLPRHHILRVRVDGPEVTVEALPLEGGPPFDVTHLSATAPPPMVAAMAAPPLVETAGKRPWTLAGGACLFLVLGLWVRRRRR